MLCNNIDKHFCNLCIEDRYSKCVLVISKLYWMQGNTEGRRPEDKAPAPPARQSHNWHEVHSDYLFLVCI